MAEAVAGAAVEILLHKLIAVSAVEIGLIWNFRKDLQKLKDSIVTIQKFLEDAGTKEVTDKSVTRWLMKLEDVVFGADYVFDELNYQLLSKKVQRGGTMKKKKVRCFFLNCKSLAFRRRMARKINDIKGELKLIHEEATELGLQLKIASAPVRRVGADVLETDSSSVDLVFVGRENDVAKIVDTVTTDSSGEHVVSVLPILGMGGCGKTTLARKVYNDAKIVSHFGKRIWVHVSENDFDPVIVLKNVAASSMGENVDGSREVVLQKLRNSLGDKKYLLVLDNVWNEDNEKWNNFINSLKGISSVKGNVIMVTSRSENVANIVRTLDIHKPEVLSENHCWFIIKALAFGGGNVDAEFEVIGANIAERCQGLPLAAQVVGSLLRGKSKDEWVSIEKNWLSGFGGEENNVSRILRLSFDNLSSPSLKKCFALCSIIPKGWWIEKDELIDLWMAEGILQTDGDEKNMESSGNNMFNLLIQSSLLHVLERDQYGNVTLCDMHDLVHDLASSILNPESTPKVRYISLAPVLKEDAKYLRALIDGKDSHMELSNFKCLHILILSDKDMNELPTEIGKLICLRYLDISQTQIEYLPDSIGDLYQLQTLRATEEYGGESCLKKLPDTLKFLFCLRHLYIPNIELPPGTGNLISLQTLPYFRVGDSEGCRIMELGSLENLKGTLEIHNLEKVRDCEEAKTAKLFDKANIFELRFVWNRCEEGEVKDENVLEGLQPHPKLKCLEINGFRGRRFPLWTWQMSVRKDVEGSCVRLDELMEIRLIDCIECEEVPMLGQLPHLKFLSLGLAKVKSLGYSFYGTREHQESVTVFPALERLELRDMENLVDWEEVGMFRCLEQLKMTNCPNLRNAPSNFPRLKELEIDNMESSSPLGNICGSKLTTLTNLEIRGVDGVVRLPDGLFHCNVGLLELSIKNCNNLTHLAPSFGGGGASLRKLNIWSCLSFMEFPCDFHSLHSLTELIIRSCPNLRSILHPTPSSPGFTSLRSLSFFGCTKLTMLPCEMVESCVPSLQELDLTGCRNLTNLPQVMTIAQSMPRLAVLGIEQVPKFIEVAAKIESLGRLQTLYLGGGADCGEYSSFETSLESFVTVLRSVRTLTLRGRQQWDALPDHLQHLTALEWLNLIDFGVETLPEWLGSLSSLTTLHLCDCEKLKCLPTKKAMEGLTNLVDLYIFNCPPLEHSLKQEPSNDSEWSKFSHLHRIIINWRQVHPQV